MFKIFFFLFQTTKFAQIKRVYKAVGSSKKNLRSDKCYFELKMLWTLDKMKIDWILNFKKCFVCKIMSFEIVNEYVKIKFQLKIDKIGEQKYWTRN